MDGRFLEPIASDKIAGPVLRVLPITAPAAGADFAKTIPGESTWMLVALTALLTPDNNATARAPVLQVTNGTQTIAQVPTGATIAASTATTISWICDGATTMTTAVGATLTVNTPKLILPPGYVVQSATTAIHSGDTWTNIVLTVVEAFTGDVAYEAQLLEAILNKLDALEPNSLVPFS